MCIVRHLLPAFSVEAAQVCVPVTFTLSSFWWLQYICQLLDFLIDVWDVWFQKSQSPFTIFSIQPNLSPSMSHHTNSNTNDLQPSINCRGQGAVSISFQQATGHCFPLGIFILTQRTDLSVEFQSQGQLISELQDQGYWLVLVWFSQAQCQTHNRCSGGVVDSEKCVCVWVCV